MSPALLFPVRNHATELPPAFCVFVCANSYLGGIFDIEALVDKSLHQLAGKQSIMVNVYDTTNEKPISMYGSNDTGSGMCQVSTLNFGDPTRKHEMHCR
jgi:histidine kinase 2/3/4 (cytokinin receptor)